MTMNLARAQTALAELRAHGVDYDPENGGVCPLCGQKKCKIYTSLPWGGGYKFRYHRCTCGFSFKSIQSKQQDSSKNL